MAFVVILHLSPGHESNLAALLQTQTTTSVMQVTEAVKIEPNHIYLVPPHNYLVISDGMIRLAEPERFRGSPTSVDLLFRTLADAYGKDAVAVLLSGTGNDGTLGLKRIKEAGGFVIAQEPAEAEYPDMPRSAIDTGLVDIILPVAEMAGKLRALCNGAQQLLLPERDEAALVPPDEAALIEILSLVRSRTGHDFSQYKRPHCGGESRDAHRSID